MLLNRFCLLILILSTFLAGCRSPRTQRAALPTPSPLNQPEINPEAAAAPHILFLLVKMEADSLSNKRQVRLLEKKKVPGVLKQNNPGPLKPSVGEIYLRLEVVGADRQVLQRFYLEHPLHKNVEYLTENQQFGRKEVLLREADFPFRLRYQPQLWHLLIFEKLPGSPEQEIGALPLH